MVARIYSPAKTATQSGRGKAHDWVLEFEPEQARTIEPLMGYTSSTDMKQQLRLRFETQEEAEAYARKNGIAYRVEQPRSRRVPKIAYSDNFRYDRFMPWTH
ncbi:ETC complex I subunit [Stappia indica]|uniref:ETC complex I subunit conserved region n=1 Tax=Stappia indica TaxID=538381 RepID=A0A285TLS8_9HYPH|nr:ETC complex I subunit [Stappia indica]MCC4246975.1 ETC complex I subunit [Stappia indica]SOC23655.1 ETC complex I subunit conserved region [Stappia indica]